MSFPARRDIPLVKKAIRQTSLLAAYQFWPAVRLVCIHPPKIAQLLIEAYNKDATASITLNKLENQKRSISVGS